MLRATRAIRWILLAALGLGSDAASSQELSSAHHRHRGGGFSAIGSGPLVSVATDPAYLRSGVALGSNAGFAAAGRVDSLRSSLPGLLWIQAGASPSLDQDFDGLSYLVDPDDDGDGLLDAYESDTGSFSGPQWTGTSPLRVDSDGDGIADGVEVANGSDPTDPDSTTGPPALPLLAPFTRLLLLGLLIALGRVASLGPLPMAEKPPPRKGRT